MCVGTAFDSKVPVYAKVVTQEYGTLKILYNCPEMAGEDIMWSKEVLAFRDRFWSTSASADELDTSLILAYMTGVKYDV